MSNTSFTQGAHRFSALLCQASTLALIGLATACSVTNNFSSDDDKKSPRKVGREENTIDSSREESRPSDEPSMVSGAFLTCQVDPALTHSTSHTGVGCTVFVDDKKVSLDSKQKWALFDPQGQPLATPFSEPKRNSGYHMTFWAPKVDLSAYQVTLDASIAAQAIHLSTHILAFSEIVSDTALKEKTLKGDFNIGDGDAANHLNVECGARIKAKKVMGTVVRIPFEVKTDEPALSIKLSDICGVSGTASYVAIHRDGESHYKMPLGVGKNAHHVTQLALPAGSYTLEIGSSFDPKLAEVDDLIVGSIKFSWQGEITIEQLIPGKL